MHCFYLDSGSFRVSNMHMVRPSAIKNIDHVRQVYGLRYQKQFRNMLKLFWLMIVYMPGGILFYLGMRISNRLRILGWNRAGRFVEKMLRQEKAEHQISKTLGGRFKIITTDFGGTAVDVDNETDYTTVKLRFQEWIIKLHNLESGSP